MLPAPLAAALRAQGVPCEARPPKDGGDGGDGEEQRQVLDWPVPRVLETLGLPMRGPTAAVVHRARMDALLAAGLALRGPRAPPPETPAG